MGDARRIMLVSMLVTVVVATDAGAQPATCADSLFASLRTTHGIPALAVAVTRGDTLVFLRTQGNAHMELGARVTPSTLFQLSSTTRILTSVLAARLAARQQLDLDAPVTDVLQDAPSGWSAITVRHLLSGTAGIPDIPGIEEDGVEDVLRTLYQTAPAPNPGTEWSYSLPEYAVLQQVLERVGGRSLPALMQQEVFTPAGMLTARYWGSDRDVIGGAATGYYPDTTVTPARYQQREFNFPPYLLSAAGIAASVEDLIRLDRAIRDERLFPRSLRDAMWRDVQLAGGRVVSYGLGWDMKTHAPGQRSAGHSGGYLTTFRTYPGSGLTAIVLANGFLRSFDPDVLATAFAAVWDPAIVGFDRPACAVERLEGAQFD